MADRLPGVLVQGTVDVEMHRIPSNILSSINITFDAVPDHHNVAVRDAGSVRRTFKCRGIGLFTPKKSLVYT